MIILIKQKLRNKKLQSILCKNVTRRDWSYLLMFDSLILNKIQLVQNLGS
jgi:hypothetical protein